MLIQRFFSYVEIKTKIASLLPFLLGLVYVTYQSGSVNWFLTGLFFISMTLFDMTTTALNNYIDTKASGTDLPFRRKTALTILLVLLALAALSGLLLALLTSPVVLLAGAACFFVGIVYTFGPAPISRMPLGEVFSGFFMGFFIPFLVVTINSPVLAPVRLIWQAPIVSLEFHLVQLMRLFLLTVPPMMGIANIMLANNICDVAHDVAIDRFTLPYYLGKKRSLLLFAALYAVAAIALTATALLDILPVYTLLALFALVPLQKNIRLFYVRQIKSETFPLSVANFILIILPVIVITAIVTAIGR